jgi:hypothetical protein
MWPIKDIALNPKSSGKDDKPFALSIDMFVSGSQTAEVEPDCMAWFANKDSGHVTKSPLSESVLLCAMYGQTLFKLLSETELLDVAKDILGHMIAKSQGETYTFAFCKRGALLVANTATSVAYSHGSRSVLGALIPQGLTSSETTTTKKHLELCATGILRHDYHRQWEMPEIDLSWPGQKTIKFLRNEDE